MAPAYPVFLVALELLHSGALDAGRVLGLKNTAK